MTAPRQAHEQAGGVVSIARLAERLAVEHDHGVGAEHQVRVGVVETGSAGEHLAGRQAPGERIGRLAGLRCLVDGDIEGLEADAELREQRAPSR